jgi:hypothetical protein|tara:strand:- start:360 stop:581 length:222 start_codon:yes stop_codon:yes gene_type:complete
MNNKFSRVIKFFSEPNKFYLLKFFGDEKKYKIREIPKNAKIDKKIFTTAPFSSLRYEFNSLYFYKVRFPKKVF